MTMTMTIDEIESAESEAAHRAIELYIAVLSEKFENAGPLMKALGGNDARARLRLPRRRNRCRRVYDQVRRLSGGRRLRAIDGAATGQALNR